MSKGLVKWISLFIVLILGIVLLVLTTCNIFGASTLTVEASSNQGSLMYGGIGFLYGLAQNTPSDQMITGLGHPQYTGQNAPNGKQHPDGYCNVVAPQAKRTGFKGVYICCPDIYAGWPYPAVGIDRYLTDLEAMAKTIVADPNHDIYVYNLFNEFETMSTWYKDKLTQMCTDWKKAYDKVKSIDKNAVIMGPSIATYNANTMKTFFTFAKNNNCMPDIATWHELGGDFYTSWYTHYNNFRSIPGCETIPININEYARREDLPIPGQLIQHLAKYESSNVWGCMPYWTGHGTLNDLVANNNTNQGSIGSSLNKPTGAWYLYHWYGNMKGTELKVTPPSLEGPLQAIASKDGKNVTVIFGGGSTTSDINIVVNGLSGSSVNYTVYETLNTGRNVAIEPAIKSTGNKTISNGTATISISGCSNTSAFKLDLIPSGTSETSTPSASVSSIPPTSKSPAQSATLVPTTSIASPSPVQSGNLKCVVNYNNQNDWGTGATVLVTIKNNTTNAINEWSLVWKFAGNQVINNLWNGKYTANGSTITVKNESWNANIPANGSLSFGFNMSYSGVNDNPTTFTLNGVACSSGD